MADDPTTIEYFCLKTTKDLIEALADADAFTAVGANNGVKKIRKQAVITRYNRRPGKYGQSEGGERGIDVPGIIITYNGHIRPVNAGENCVDDGRIKILVQIVDEGDDSDIKNIASYLDWMAKIRKGLQESALESCPIELGQVYLVHVIEASPADETDWAFQENMRQAIVITCFTRTPRK